MEIKESFFEKTWGLHHVSLGEVLNESIDGRITGKIFFDEGKFIYKIPSVSKTIGGGCEGCACI